MESRNSDRRLAMSSSSSSPPPPSIASLLAASTRTPTRLTTSLTSEEVVGVVKWVEPDSLALSKVERASVWVERRGGGEG